MHELVLGKRADHINGNGLDNRLINLREATPGQNRMNSRRNTNNTSGYKGVSRFGSRWKAQITFNYQRIYLGLFDTIEAAAQAYDMKARELFGAHAKTNEDLR